LVCLAWLADQLDLAFIFEGGLRMLSVSRVGGLILLQKKRQEEAMRQDEAAKFSVSKRRRMNVPMRGAEAAPDAAGSFEAAADAQASEEESQLARARAAFSGGLQERLFLPGQVPNFVYDAAVGTPYHWNKLAAVRHWGNKCKKRLADVLPEAAAAVDWRKVKEFLEKRIGPDGLPISTRLAWPPETTMVGGKDEEPAQHWFRCAWKGFSAGDLPMESPGEWSKKAEWVKAWHGCKVEALYSIMYHGQLRESRNAGRGERFFGQFPGVYVHKDGTKHKTGSYTRFVPLCRDGVYWATVWEVMVDRADRVAVSASGTDQWVQRERSVRLVALWLCGRTALELEPGSEVAEVWDPNMEANPLQDGTTDIVACEN